MAPSSSSFEADLPTDMTPSQLEKLYEWGKTSCKRLDVHMDGESKMILTAVRHKAGSVRDHQRLLRTNMTNWGVQFQTKQAGWLRLISDSAPIPPSDTTQDAAAPIENSVPAPLVAQARESLLRLPANLLTVCCENTRSIEVPARVCRAN